MKFAEAKTLAYNQSLDLVVISQQPSGTVCKIMDEGKWKYEQRKKDKLKNHKNPETKELRFHINTDQHDIDIKMAQIRKFIEKGHSVRISIEMKGRDKSHPELARAKLGQIITTMGDIAKYDNIKSSVSSVSVIAIPNNTM